MFDTREKEREQIKVYVLKDTADELREIAYSKQVSLSELLRGIVLDYLNARGAQ